MSILTSENYLFFNSCNSIIIFTKNKHDIAFYAYVVPFLISTIGGSLLAGLLVAALQKNGALAKIQATI